MTPQEALEFSIWVALPMILAAVALLIGYGIPKARKGYRMAGYAVPEGFQ